MKSKLQNQTINRWNSIEHCAAGGIVWLKFSRRSRDPKKGVGLRRLKYRLPENPGILSGPLTSVRRNGLVKGYTFVNHSRWSFAWSFLARPEGLNKFSVEIYLVLFGKLPNFTLKLTPHNLQKSSTLSSLAFLPLTGFVGVSPLDFKYSPWEVAMRAVNRARHFAQK